MNDYQDLIRNLVSGVFIRTLGEPGSSTDRAWARLSQRSRDERIEEAEDFVRDALERSRAVLIEEWRR